MQPWTLIINHLKYTVTNVMAVSLSYWCSSTNLNESWQKAFTWSITKLKEMLRNMRYPKHFWNFFMIPLVTRSSVTTLILFMELNINHGWTVTDHNMPTGMSANAASMNTSMNAWQHSTQTLCSLNLALLFPYCSWAAYYISLSLNFFLNFQDRYWILILKHTNLYKN